MEDEIKSGKLEELESRYLTGASLGGIAVPVIKIVIEKMAWTFMIQN